MDFVAAEGPRLQSCPPAGSTERQQYRQMAAPNRTTRHTFVILKFLTAQSLNVKRTRQAHIAKTNFRELS